MRECNIFTEFFVADMLKIDISHGQLRLHFILTYTQTYTWDCREYIIDGWLKGEPDMYRIAVSLLLESSLLN